MLDTYLKDLPLIAILRGVTPDEIVPVGRALYDAGFRVIEIPLNSPQPFESIRRLTAELGDRCVVVLETERDHGFGERAVGALEIRT